MKKSILFSPSLIFGSVILSFIVVIFAFHTAFAQGTEIGSQLSLGSKGNDVTTLQTFLATNSMIYPSGLVTGYYGPLTEAAVAQFQLDYNLPQVGNVGPLTLAKINSLISSGLGLDISAPGISDVAVNTGATTATVSWVTNEGASANVYYSTSPLSETEASQDFTAPVISGTVMSDGTLGTSKAITLSSLQSGTTYYYVIESIDQSGNVNVTPESTFTTMIQ